MPNTQSYNDGEVRSQLMTFVMEAAGGVSFSAECRDAISRIISESVRERWSRQAVQDESRKLSVARSNIHRFVQEMKDHSFSHGSPQIEIASFREALSKLCPFFPFCL